LLPSLLKKTAKLNDRNKMPLPHTGTFIYPNAQLNAPQAKEPEFLTMIEPSK